MDLPLQDFNGPHKAEAEQIVRTALLLDERVAKRLATCWDGTNTNEDYLTYLKHCKMVWDALEESGRFLPLGWFEAIFADCEWADKTKALHPIADAVCATLARDLVPNSTFRYLIAPWRAGSPIAVN